VIGLDTNILVRHIVQDDQEQSKAATRLIEAHCAAEDPGIISLVVLCELVWVLDRGYGYSREIIVGVLRMILTAEDLCVEQADLAWLALNLFEGGKADFADYLIGLVNKRQGAEFTYTFDRRAIGCELFKLA
jgi:predicted nucleic-acid-binding protein